MSDPPQRPPAATPGNPWELREEIGYPAGLGRTVWELIRAPVRAFAATRERGGLGGPLLFAVVVLLVAGLLGDLVDALLALATAGGVESLELPGDVFGLEIAGRSFDWLPIPLLGVTGCFVALVVGTPVAIVAITVLLFAWSGLLHLGLLLTGALRRSHSGWRGSFRGLCFAQVGMLGQALPWIGEAVALVWTLALVTLAMVRFHRTGVWRAVGGTLLAPVLAVAIALAVVFGAELLPGG